MAELIAFPKSHQPVVLPHPQPQPAEKPLDGLDPEVERQVAELLERARSGEAVAVAIVEVNRDNRPRLSYRFQTGTEYAVLAGACLLQQELLDLAVAPDEDDEGGEEA